MSETQLRRRIRELTANLVRDVMNAISMAAADELGELIPADHDGRNGAAQSPSKSPKRRERERPAPKPRDNWVALADDAANEREAGSPPPPNDPFDITSPMELLASTDQPSTRRAAMEERPARIPAILEHPRAAESVTSLIDGNGDKEAASERRPTVVLREGERLLSAAASGIVIRRERRIAPPR